ncbi:hypothetical protein ACCS64_39940, partial [Rhizobium ruizarguesonis]
RANWYAHEGDDTSEAASETFKREGPWHRRVREECIAVRDKSGILDLPGFSRFKVSGNGARGGSGQDLTRVLRGDVGDL